MAKKNIRSTTKYKKIMTDFKSDNLKHSSGYTITNAKQARAIAKNTSKPGSYNANKSNK